MPMLREYHLLLASPALALYFSFLFVWLLREAQSLNDVDEQASKQSHFCCSD